MSDDQTPARKQPVDSTHHVMAEVDRLLCDKNFRVSARQRRLLKYIAEKSVNDDVPKAYSIGLDVFDRTPDFDSNTDPIVRVEMSRLRVAMQTYYESFPRLDCLLIPIGSYRLTLIDLEQEAESERPVQVPQTSPPLGKMPILSGKMYALLAAGLLASVTLQVVQIALLLRG